MIATCHHTLPSLCAHKPSTANCDGAFIHSFINARRGRRDAAKRERVNLSLKRPRAVSLITLQLVHPRPAEAMRAKRLCFCAGAVSGWLVTNTRFSRLISSDVARNFSLGSKKVSKFFLRLRSAAGVGVHLGVRVRLR